MKKNLYLLSLLLLCSIFCSYTTSAQYWCWAMDTSIMTEAGASQSAAADLYGNVYAYGTGKRLLKHNTSDGSVDWMLTGLGGIGWNTTMLVTDNPGNVYMLYDSSAYYKIVKLDSFGNTIWATTATCSTGAMRAFTINPDNLGNFLVCGTLGATPVVAGTLSATGAAPNQNSFVARYDTAGHPKWIKPVTSPWYARVFSVAGDLSGNVFMGGICKGDTLKIFDTTVILGIGTGMQGIFVAKCDSNGHLLWVTANRHTNSSLSGSAVAACHIRVDDAGNAYFAGMFYETDTLGNSLGSVPIVFAGGDNVFMAKYRGSDGGVQWAQTGGNTTMLYSMSCSSLGKPYLIFRTSTFTTHFSTSSFTLTGPSASSASTVVGFDSSGTVICGFMLGGQSAEDDVGVVTDMQGNAYIHGDYMATVYFGDIVKTSTTGERYFLTKYTCNCLCGTSLSIGATGALCVGNTVTMTSSGSGGTWTSSTPGVASITPGGLITAIAPGTTVISYATGGGCNGSAIVTVVAMPAITGGALCFGTTTTLTASPSGGTWTSVSTSIATIDPATGVVTGLALGTSTISYEVASGCAVTAVVTVSATAGSPPGTAVLCTGGSVTLTGSTPGGTWVSSGPSVAGVGLSTGVVNGLSAGTAVITYASTSGCPELTNVTVNAAPGPISGKMSICEGFNTLLTCNPAGGTWSSSSPVATISPTGLYTGVSAGTAIITYMMPGGCYSTAIVTVNALPSITGTTTIAVGSSPTLTGLPAGGSWSSMDTTKVKVNVSTGKLTGVSLGTSTIYYSLPGTGCKTSVVVTVVKNTAVSTNHAAAAKPTLFPNPASSEITVKADQSVYTTLVVYNAVGQTMITHAVTTGEIKVNVKSLPAGQYRAVFRGDGVSETVPFVKW